MSKKTSDTTQTPPTLAESSSRLKESDELLPEGFTNSSSLKSTYFFDRKLGDPVIRGVILGYYPKRGGYDGFFYQLVLTGPCSACKRWNDALEDYEQVECQEGDIVNIDESAAMEAFRGFVEGTQNGRYYEVFVRFLGKQKTRNGMTAWKCVLGHKKYRGDIEKLKAKGSREDEEIEEPAREEVQF